MHRFFLDERCRLDPSGEWELSPALQKHLRAARIGAKEPFVLADPATGRAFEAILLGKSRASVEKDIALAGTGPVPIELALGLSKPDSLESAIGGASELGVVRVHLLGCERSLPGKPSASKLARLARIAQSGAEVAGRGTIPEILPPVGLKEFAARLSKEKNLARFVLWEETVLEGSHPSLASALQKTPAAPAGALIVVGPEGGLTKDEVLLLTSSGFLCTGLGPRILRARTAPLVALSLVQAFWGDLG